VAQGIDDRGRRAINRHFANTLRAEGSVPIRLLEDADIHRRGIKRDGSHPVLNFPNKITTEDFKDWVQERSTYQMVQIDSHYETPLGMNDKGEKESNGSLAIAKYGKGNFVYTGLVFFRQLPAGVPGAFRLMANLIALARR
jgi:hypothetical protein